MDQETGPFPASFQATQRRLFTIATQAPSRRTPEDTIWLVQELARSQKFEAAVRVAADGTRDLTGIVPATQRMDEVLAAAMDLDTSRQTVNR